MNSGAESLSCTFPKQKLPQHATVVDKAERFPDTKSVALRWDSRQPQLKRVISCFRGDRKGVTSLAPMTIPPSL